MFDLAEMMRKAQEMKSRMDDVQAELEKKQITADAAGIARATVNGKMELVALKIDATKYDVNDTELLQDAIIAAVKAAQKRAQDFAKDQMQKVATDMGLPPGMLPG
jgi:DNA-binding YbaB/EbfC family protein